jgi:hypothetical protein
MEERHERNWPAAVAIAGTALGAGIAGAGGATEGAVAAIAIAGMMATFALVRS